MSPLPRFKVSARQINVGRHEVDVKIVDTPTRELRSHTHDRGHVTDLLSKYRAIADEAGVTLDTAMRTLPRGSLSLSSTYSENYKSVRVEVGLEMTFPGFEPKTAEEMYADMMAKVEYVVSKNIEEARAAAGI